MVCPKPRIPPGADSAGASTDQSLGAWALRRSACPYPALESCRTHPPNRTHSTFHFWNAGLQSTKAWKTSCLLETADFNWIQQHPEGGEQSPPWSLLGLKYKNHLHKTTSQSITLPHLEFLNSCSQLYLDLRVQNKSLHCNFNGLVFIGKKWVPGS